MTDWQATQEAPKSKGASTNTRSASGVVATKSMKSQQEKTRKRRHFYVFVSRGRNTINIIINKNISVSVCCALQLEQHFKVQGQHHRNHNRQQAELTLFEGKLPIAKPKANARAGPPILFARPATLRGATPLHVLASPTALAPGRLALAVLCRPGEGFLPGCLRGA